MPIIKLAIYLLDNFDGLQIKLMAGVTVDMAHMICGNLFRRDCSKLAVSVGNSLISDVTSAELPKFAKILEQSTNCEIFVRA